MLFDEAEKDFDIDSFLAPYFPDEYLAKDEDTVFGSPLSSPNSSKADAQSVVTENLPENHEKKKVLRSQKKKNDGKGDISKKRKRKITCRNWIYCI